MSHEKVLTFTLIHLAVGFGLATAARAQVPETRPDAPFTPLSTPPVVDHLRNGLTVVTVPWDSPGIIAYYTLVRAGSRDEVEAGHSGYAHLFEHMMFRGTQRFPQDVYERRIQSFGADNNAHTTQDFTLYTITAPSDVLADLVDLEADRFQHLQYDESQYRTETGAVLGEYNKSAANPFLRMWETLSGMAFTRHTYGHTTMGYLRDIRSMPGEVAYSRRFFRRFYTPDDCTIIVAGDVDHDALLRLVRQRYGGWRGRRAHPRVPAEPAPLHGATRHIAWQGTTPSRMFLAWRTPAFAGSAHGARARARALRETAALQVVHGLLFDRSSPLYRRLVVEERKLLELDSWAGELSRDPHLFVASAVLSPGQPFEAVTDVVQAELDGLAAGSVDIERVEAVKSHARYDFLMKLETPDQVADTLASFIAVGGGTGAMDAYLAALGEVTPEDVARVAGAYMNASRRFVVTLASAAQEGGAEPGPGGAPGAGVAAGAAGGAR